MINKKQPLRQRPIQTSSVAQSCQTLCDATDCRTPGFPVYHPAGPDVQRKSAFYSGGAGASWRLRSVLVSGQEVFVLGRSQPGGQMALMCAGQGRAGQSIKVEKAVSQASWP